MAVGFATDSDDDGSGTTGTIHNAAWKAAMATAIDALVGDWTAVTFAGGNFTGSGSMSWTVASGDVTTFAYRIVNKSMTVAWHIDTSTVGGTLNTDLRITIPASKVATRTQTNPYYYVDNGTHGVGLAQVNASGTVIRLLKVGYPNWTAATDATSAYGEITFQIN